MDTCPKCRSTRIMRQLEIVDQAGHYIRPAIRVYDNPDATLFKGTHVSGIRCDVCGDCGYFESYVQNPQELHAAYVEAGRRRG